MNLDLDLDLLYLDLLDLELDSARRSLAHSFTRLAQPDAHSPLKIIDFGLSRYDDEVGHMTTKVGTPYYIAPEVLTR